MTQQLERNAGGLPVRELGNSGVKVSIIGFGGGHFIGTASTNRHRCGWCMAPSTPVLPSWTRPGNTTMVRVSAAWE